MSSQIVCRRWLVHFHSPDGFLYDLDLTNSDCASVPESMLEKDSATMNEKGFTQWPGWIKKHWVIISLFWSHIPSFETSYSWNGKAKTHWAQWSPPIFLAQNLSVSQQINHASFPFFSKVISSDWNSFWWFFLQLLFCLFSYWSNGQHTSVINDKKAPLWGGSWSPLAGGIFDFYL